MDVNARPQVQHGIQNADRNEAHACPLEGRWQEASTASAKCRSEHVCVGDLVLGDLLTPASPSDHVRLREDVGAMRRAATAPASGAMTIDHVLHAGVDFERYIPAQATAADRAVVRR